MFFKREKNTPISFIAILEKYDINPLIIRAQN